MFCDVMAQEAPGAPLAKAMAARFGGSAGADDVPAVRLLRRRAVDTLTDALHELSRRGFAPKIAQRLQQAIGLLQGPQRIASRCLCCRGGMAVVRLPVFPLFCPVCATEASLPPSDIRNFWRR